MSGDSRFAHRPGAVLRAGTLTAALGVAALVTPSTALSLAVSVIGVLALAIGVTRQIRWVTGLGALGVIGAVVVATFAGITVERLLPAVVGSVLVWEFAHGAFTAEAELEGGHLERAELLHVVLATVGASLVATVAYVAYETLTVSPSLPGAALLVVAATALALGLRE